MRRRLQDADQKAHGATRAISGNRSKQDALADTKMVKTRLGPARGAVGHHGEVVAHVAEVLGQRDARVDGRLARRHRHVARVGHLRAQRGADMSGFRV